MYLFPSLARACSSDGEEQSGRKVKRVRTGNVKKPSWDEREEDSEIQILNEDVALEAFLADPGLAWLEKQSMYHLTGLFCNLTGIDKKNWKDDFREASGRLSGWPGKVSDDGLLAVHLSPDCEL
jgi:hypothetical protein